MKYYRLAFLLFLFFSLRFNNAIAQNANTIRFKYKVTYSQSYFNEQDAITNMLRREMAKNAFYIGYADSTRLQITGGGTLNPAKRTKDTFDMGYQTVAATYKLKGAQEVLFQKDNGLSVLSFDGNKYSCFRTVDEVFVNTGIKKKIRNYMCDKWIPLNPAYQFIELWVCSTLNKEINIGYALNQLPGGVVYVNIAGKYFYTLWDFDTVNHTFPTPACNSISGKFNILTYTRTSL
ncbi:hypothetical protein ACTHGU_08620 [Chitinophagaceae bacterium MMS25-I14]